MKQFLFAHCANLPAGQLLEECLRQLGDIPPEATLGFLYATDHLGEQLPQLLQGLREATGVQHWVGTLGMGLIASQNEYYDVPALAIMIADFNEADYRLLPNFTHEANVTDSELASWCQAHDFHVGLVHADPENPALQTLMAQLADTIPQAFLVGGITSSRSRHYQIADEVMHGGLSGVLFSDQLSIISNLTQGCIPTGPRHRVTLADRNIVYTLDHKPALDVLTEDVGELMARDWERASGFIFAGLVNPNSDTDDYTVRQLIGVDENAKIFAIGDYVENSQDIIFCRRDGSSATDDMQRMLLQMKSRIKTKPRGGVYVSCLGRGREQFGDNSEEVRMIHAMLGDFPLVGFFANGEIHNNRLYGFTGVLTLFL